MDSQQVLAELRALDLPVDQYVVVGGAALSIRGLRSTEDIDLVVVPILFDKLKSAGWRQKTRPNGAPGLKRGCVEIYLDVNTESFGRGIDWLLAHAEIMEGVPLVDLETLMGWKKTYGREKDTRDVELLERVLREKAGAPIQSPDGR